MIRKICILGAMAFLTSGLVSGQSHSSARTVTLHSFDVIGIQCRTSNADEAAGKGYIGRQWERFVRESLLQKIPARADGNILAVYTDYENDKDGEYSYILGAKVKSGTDAPPGMVKATVNAGRFALFTSDTGPVQQVVPATWKRIWELPKAQPGGNRLY